MKNQLMTRPSHPLVSKLANREESALRQFISGLGVPLRSARFLMKNRGLWPLAAIPAALSFVIFVVLAIILVFQSDWFLGQLWARPEDWLVVLWWVLRLVMMLVTLLATYFLTLVISAVVASPANDRLALRIEEIITGRPRGAADGTFAEALSGGARGAIQALANLGILMVVMLPVFSLNLLPVVGSVIASALATLVASFFIALDYTDWTLERETYGWRDKWRGIWGNRHLALGFGLGTSLLMWVPVINLLSMPIAVVGGASLALEIKARKEDSYGGLKELADEDAR